MQAKIMAQNKNHVVIATAHKTECLKNVAVRLLLGTRFINAVSCFKPGSHEHYRDI
jgi:hypothetical protein